MNCYEYQVESYKRDPRGFHRSFRYARFRLELPNGVAPDVVAIVTAKEWAKATPPEDTQYFTLCRNNKEVACWKRDKNAMALRSLETL